MTTRDLGLKWTRADSSAPQWTIDRQIAAVVAAVVGVAVAEGVGGIRGGILQPVTVLSDNFSGHHPTTSLMAVATDQTAWHQTQVEWKLIGSDLK